MADQIADLSIEICHIYLGELTEKMADERAAACAAWITPALERWQRAKKRVSISVMIDDYFPSRWIKSGRTIAEAGEIICAACERHGLPVNYLCLESACVPIAAQMPQRLIVRPREGAGSRKGPREETRLAETEAWLTNGDVFRASDVGEFLAHANKQVAATHMKPESHHALFLDVELFNNLENGVRKWSCPALAAAWQLNRLGITLDAKKTLEPPCGTTVYSDAVPFVGRKTLTVLPPRMLPVEHAVRTIIGSLEMEPNELMHLAVDKRGVNVPSLLDRIAYIFAGDDFEPLPLRRSRKV